MSSYMNAQELIMWMSEQSLKYRDEVQFNLASHVGHSLVECLRQPTLPKESDADMIKAMYEGCAGGNIKYASKDILNSYRKIYDALYNHLTALPKPKTKKIKVWRVEYVHNGNGMPQCITAMSSSSANNYAEHMRKGPHTCINIIEGEQEVPE